MNMAPASSDRLEMNIMWAIMGVMFVVDIAMVYIHLKLHKKVVVLEKELSEK
jgi:hypothetical protein